MDKQKLIIVLAALGVVAGARKRFDGDKVFRITPKDKNEVDFIHQLIDQIGVKIDVWKEPSVPGRDVDLHVMARDVDEFIQMLDSKGMQNIIVIEDLEKAIHEEEVMNQRNTFSVRFDYEKYNRYNDIKHELISLAGDYAHASTFSVGKTYDDNLMLGIKITAPGSTSKKTAIWVDGGIHAREWISPATVMYLVKMLLQPETKELKSAVSQALKNYDFYILPVFNVDGYEHTHTKDRMWRKTRSRGKYCYGVDPNRNWESHFGGVSSSPNECSEIYRGKSAFSEIEVKQVAAYLRKLSNDVGLKSYWNVHAYSQVLMFPWSYTKSRANDYNEIKRVAEVFQWAVKKKSGKNFPVGQPPDILYAVSGGSIDWTYEKLHVKYSYAPELRPAPGELYNGFLLPPQYIRASGLEFASGILAAVNAML